MYYEMVRTYKNGVALLLDLDASSYSSLKYVDINLLKQYDHKKRICIWKLNL